MDDRTAEQLLEAIKDRESSNKDRESSNKDVYVDLDTI